MSINFLKINNLINIFYLHQIEDYIFYEKTFSLMELKYRDSKN